MADTQTATVEGIDEGINTITLTTDAYRGESQVSLERIEHLGGEVSYFTLAEDIEGSVHASYTVEQMKALRDFLIRTLG